MSKKVRPMRAYAAPLYPTSSEICCADVSRVPVRWRGLKAVASTLGAAAMSLKALALEAQDAAKPVAAAPVVSVPNVEKSAERDDAESPATEVCPLPAKEIAGEGAGSFGCIAMNPPVTLSEDEALDIIEREFAKRGLNLKDCATLDGVEMPDVDWLDKLLPEEVENIYDNLFEKDAEAPKIPHAKKRCLLDFGTTDGNLLVEYVSVSDQQLWVWNPWEYSSVYAVRTRKAAEEIVKGLSARTTGKPVTVGVFYDPCATVPEDWRPTLPEGVKPGTPEADDAMWDQRRASGEAVARAKLVAQIEHFFEYLASRGKMPKAGVDAPDASSH